MQNKTDVICYDVFDSGVVTDKLQKSCNTAEKIDENMTEFYIIAKDWSWTYIKTHEDDLFGPYFMKIPK